MVCQSRPYHFKFFKGCLPQILLLRAPSIHSHKSIPKNIDIDNIAAQKTVT